jgi:uncharacterized protein YbjT (DUF2867 family)
MNILLIGASGFIGQHLTVALGAAGHTVRPAGRRQGMDLMALQSPADWHPHLSGIEAVINAAGIIGESGGQSFAPLHHRGPAGLFRACADAGIRRVVQISALGADETAFSAYHLSKRAADDVLRRLDLDWFVLRPSLIYGPGGKSAGRFMALARLPWIPVLEDGGQHLQPVHISDVVATTLACLEARPSRLTLDIVGPETFTFAEWLQRLRLAQGLPRGRLWRIPFAAAMAVAYLGRHLDPLLQPDNLRMLRAGYWADPGPLMHFLGRTPLASDIALGLANGATNTHHNGS